MDERAILPDAVLFLKEYDENCRFPTQLKVIESNSILVRNLNSHSLINFRSSWAAETAAMMQNVED
jgi:hypothetical protein